MASDLSKLIEESLTSTLTGLLGKEALLQEVTKADLKDLENIELLQVQSVFDFENFTSLFTFMIPARTSSLIFHTMMASSLDNLSNSIDDDTEDAIGEFISNTSGALTTYINGAQFEDLGQTKFNISHKKKIQGDEISSVENTYRFQIDLEGHEIIIFIIFDTSMLDHIQEISNARITPHSMASPQIEKEVVQEESPEKIVQEESPKEIPPEEIIQQEIPPTDDPHAKKIKMAIIGVAATLGLTLLAFVFLFFMGFFDPIPEPPKQEEALSTEAELTKPEKNDVEVVKYTTLQKIDFQASDIDEKRLNRQLAALTKYNVLNKEELEAQALAEKNRLFELEREKELLEFSKQNNEEPIFQKKPQDIQRDIDKKTKFTNEDVTPATEEIAQTTKEAQEEETNDVVKEETQITLSKELVQTDPIEPNQLRYVTTNSLRYTLFKSVVVQSNSKSARISICNDESGKTTIYIGPFETNNLQNGLIEEVTRNNKTISMNPVNITEEEFNVRCNLE